MGYRRDGSFPMNVIINMMTGARRAARGGPSRSDLEC
jgi:hypothetical protein